MPEDQKKPPDDSDPIATSSELEWRRERVLSLRLRRMTEAAIAGIVGVSLPTVSRDLAWIAKNWRDRYGLAPQFDPAETVGETLALYQDVEKLALLEHSRIADECSRHAEIEVECPSCLKTTKVTTIHRIDPIFAAKQRMACLNSAAAAREKQINLLQDLGVLERALGSLRVTLPRAAEIRESMRRIQAEDLFVVSEAERLEPPPKKVN